MPTLPLDVHNGMQVFDRAHNEIGTVDEFKFSENEDNPKIEPGVIDESDRKTDSSLVDNIAAAFSPSELPEELRDRLLSEGYIRLDTKGLFAADRYILPEQIAAAN